MRTIVLTPTKDGDEVLPLCLQRIGELDPQPSEVIFLPTGPAPAIDEWDWDGTKTTLTERIPSENYNIFSETAAIMQTLLNAAKKADPDYAIIVADDMQILSKDAITSLTSWKEDLVGCAVVREGINGRNIDFFNLHHTGRGDEHIMEAITLPPGPQGWVETPPLPSALYNPTFVGGGGLCISRRALQDPRLYFHPVTREDYAEDFGYCLRARRAGYEIWVDATVRISHHLAPRGRPWTEVISAN